MFNIPKQNISDDADYQPNGAGLAYVGSAISY